MVLELIKLKKNQQYIMEVLRIYPDINKIIVYQPNNGKGCPISNRPPPMPNDRSQYFQYEYKNLPHIYWKKYDLASR